MQDTAGNDDREEYREQRLVVLPKENKASEGVKVSLRRYQLVCHVERPRDLHDHASLDSILPVDVDRSGGHCLAYNI